MAAFYRSFTSVRSTVPDSTQLIASLRVLDGTIGLEFLHSSLFVIKKSTAWLPAHIAAAQSVIDTAPELTPRTTAKDEIRRWPISTKAFVEVLLDEINALRALHSLPPRSLSQVVTAVLNEVDVT